MIDANGAVGSADMVRTFREDRRTRRRCNCGCKTRASHIGLGDGVALVTGCEWKVRKWCQDPQYLYSLGWYKWDTETQTTGGDDDG